MGPDPTPTRTAPLPLSEASLPAHPVDYERLRRVLADLRRTAADVQQIAQALARLTPRQTSIRVTARFSAADLAFFGAARRVLALLTDTLTRLLEFHAPADGGGISSDPAAPILECRACHKRWPCPTIRILATELDAACEPR